MIYRLYDLDEGFAATLCYIELPPGLDGKAQDDRLKESLRDRDIGFEALEVQSFTRAEDVGPYYEADGLAEPRDPALDIDNGTECSVCGERQFRTTSGMTCRNGHGGADPR